MLDLVASASGCATVRINIFKYSSAANSAYNVAAWHQPSNAVPRHAMGLEDVPIAFFSYCREDSEFALKLAADLKLAGASVWIDQLDIEPGTPWDRAVEDALTNSPHMLVVLSPVSVKSDNVRDEVSFALSRQKRVIPVLYRDCDVPFRLARLQHIDFRADYARALGILLRALGHAPHAQPPVAAAVAAEVAGSPDETQEQVQQQSEAEDRASQEQSRREQRAAEQARLETEARLAAERVRQVQQEKDRREAEIKARQEQLRREEQESVERKGLVIDPALQAPPKMPVAQPLPPQPTPGGSPLAEPIAAVAAQPAARPVSMDPPKPAQVEARVPPPIQPQSSGHNLASPKYFAAGAAAVLVLGLVMFMLVHRSGPQGPSQSNVAESQPAGPATIQPAQPQTATGNNPSETAPAQPAPSGTAPANSANQDQAKTSPTATEKDLAKAKNQARPAAELSDLNPSSTAQPLNAANAANASSPASGSKRVRLSQGVSHGMLMYEVAPKYPPLARSARVQGQVVLDVVIGRDGTVADIRAESGHPLLIPSAIDAVKHWRYKPYRLNGKPVEVDTQVIVNFTLTNS